MRRSIRNKSAMMTIRSARREKKRRNEKSKNTVQNMAVSHPANTQYLNLFNVVKEAQGGGG